MSTLPIPIDGSVPVAALAAAFGAAVGGPWQYGGALYIAVTDYTYSAFTAVYKSTDNGNTWSELDQAGRPTVYGIAQFDGGHTIVTAFPSAGNGVDGPMHLINFDLSTETWGAVYGTSGSPTGLQAAYVGFRPDGSIVLLYGHFADIFNQDAAFFATYKAGAWSAALEIDVNYANRIALGGGSLTTAAIGADGTVYAFMALTGHAPLPWNVFYQEITPSNTLGNFHKFPDSNDGQLVSLPVPVILPNAKLFVPAYVSDAGAVGYFLGIGTSWGSVVGPIDPGLGADPTLIVQVGSTPGMALIAGDTLTFIYVVQGSNISWIQARMRLLTTKSLSDPSTGWTGQTLTDAELYPSTLLPIGAPDSQRLLGLGPFLPGVGCLFNMFQPQSASFHQMAFFLNIPLLAPVPPIKITFRGVKRIRCKPQDDFAEMPPPLPSVDRAV